MWPLITAFSVTGSGLQSWPRRAVCPPALGASRLSRQFLTATRRGPEGRGQKPVPPVPAVVSRPPALLFAAAVLRCFESRPCPGPFCLPLSCPSPFCPSPAPALSVPVALSPALSVLSVPALSVLLIPAPIPPVPVMIFGSPPSLSRRLSSSLSQPRCETNPPPPPPPPPPPAAAMIVGRWRRAGRQIVSGVRTVGEYSVN